MTMTIKILAVGALGVAATTGSAIATEASKGQAQPVVITAPAAPAPTHWNGFYGGGSLGMGSTNYKLDATASIQGNPIAGISLPDLGGTGAVYGLQAGYNWRATDQLVLGVQIDANMTNVTNTTTGFITGVGSLDYELKPRHEMALTLRLGYVPSERTMIYGLAGVSRARFQGTLNINDGGGVNVFATNYSFDRTGWTVGAGIATMVTDQISVGLEYRYTDYRRHTLFNGTVGQALIDTGFNTTMQSVRGTVNFHF